jgi:hypothetical protein
LFITLQQKISNDSMTVQDSLYLLPENFSLAVSTNSKLLILVKPGLPIPYYKIHFRWMPVAHAYYSSYSGGRDEEDYSSKPA